MILRNYYAKFRRQPGAPKMLHPGSDAPPSYATGAVHCWIGIV